MTRSNRHLADLFGDAYYEKKHAEKKYDRVRAAVHQMMDRMRTSVLVGDEYTVRRKPWVLKGVIDARKLKADGINPDKYRRSAKETKRLDVDRRASSSR